MRRAPRRFLFPLLLLAAGCGHLAVDSRRPLAVRAFPQTDRDYEVLHQQYRTGGTKATRDSVRESMGLAAGARDTYGIVKRNDWVTFVPVGDLARAIDRMPDNPFAWIQLGAYLALDHQTQAAILATERGLKSIDVHCPEGTRIAAVRQLRTTGYLNLAQYRSDAERPLSALLALQQMTPADLPATERILYYWKLAEVKNDLADSAGARDALRGAAAVTAADVELDANKPGAFADLRDSRRVALQAYLEATVDREAGDLADATQKLNAAIMANPRLWDAYLLLADIHLSEKSYKTAIQLLRDLANAPLHEVFRPERRLFNLGNLYLRRYDQKRELTDLVSAEDAFNRAADLQKRRFQDEQRQLRRAGAFSQRETARFFLDALSLTSPVYADAHNNLGTVYEFLAANTKSPITAGNWALNAETEWRLALQDQYWPRRQFAYANLARLYANEGRFDDAAEASEASLDLDPLNVVPLKALLDVAEREPDEGKAARVAFIVARLVARRRYQYPPGTLDALFAPATARLRTANPTTAARKAIRMIELALSPEGDVSNVLRNAKQELPEWTWPAIELARRERLDRSERAAMEERLAIFLAGDSGRQDWTGKRERGDALLLRAAFREEGGDLRGARRDLERAIADGATRHAATDLLERVDNALQTASAPPVSSLAVLPFDNIHTDDQEAWGHSLSMTMTTIFRGARSRMVRSLERDALEGTDWNASSAAEVGRLSGVGAVLSGRYTRSGQLLVMDVKVVDTLTGVELFTQRYEDSPNRVRDVQVRIVTDVLNALNLAPAVPAAEVAAKAFSAAPDAYCAYLEGMNIVLAGAHTEAELERAKGLLAAAADRDPKFARAQAGVAWTRYELANLYVRPTEIMPQAVRAAEEAVRLSPESSETQLAVALVRTWYDWNTAEGDAAFKAARDIDPENASVRRMYGDLLAAEGRLEEALQEKRLALESAPLSAHAMLDVGLVQFYLGHYDEAMSQADRAIALQPGLAKAFMLKSWVLTVTGHFEEALNALALASSHEYLARETPLLLAHRGVIYARAGDSKRAEGVLDELERMRRGGRYVLPLFDARVLAALGRRHEAYAKLSLALKDRSESMVWLGVDPWFESLRGDPEFARLLHAVLPASHH